MNKFLASNNSNKLILFFSGWGCDEFEFQHLKSKSDVLVLYNYTDLNLDFDFSKYKEINLLAFSAGVFVSSIFKFDFKINKSIAISGNPYLFDKKLGLSKEMIKIFKSITQETCNDFAKNYLVKTDEEFKRFNNSKRTIESCNAELDALYEIYNSNKQNINDIFDYAVMGEDDPIFNIEMQKEFYKDKLVAVKNARHNLFFRIDSFEDAINLKF